MAAYSLIIGDAEIIPAWRTAMADYTVIELPTSNTLSDLNPKNDAAINPNYPGNPEWWGITGFDAIITTWCGACGDTEHNELWFNDGGGHGDYGGNDRLKLILKQAVPAYVRVRNPSGAIGNLLTTDDGQEATGIYSDGETRACHSYNYDVYIPGVGPAKGIQGRCYSSAAAGLAKPIWYDRTTGASNIVNATNGSLGVTPSGGAACFDATRGTQGSIWYRSTATAKMTRLDWAAETWSDVGSSVALGEGEISLAAHPSGDYLLLGKNPYPLDTGATSAAAWKIVKCSDGTIHAPTFSGTAAGSLRPGYCRPWWVPSLSAFVAWDNSSSTNTLTLLTPGTDPFTDTWTISTQSFTGATVSTRQARGTYGRFNYFPDLNGFVLVNSTSESGYFFAVP